MRNGTRQRIVVGVSGSKASIAALRWAAEEARDRHARLDVVRAWGAPPRAHYAAGAGSTSAEAARASAGRELAAIMNSTLGTAAEVPAVAVVAEEVAERALVAQCDGAEMLVLGAHSSSDPVSGPVGPVIRGCLSRAPCPVVVVTADA